MLIHVIHVMFVAAEKSFVTFCDRSFGFFPTFAASQVWHSQHGLSRVSHWIDSQYGMDN